MFNGLINNMPECKNLRDPVLENFTAIMLIYLFIAQFMKNQFLMKNDMPRKSQRTKTKRKERNTKAVH